MAELQRRTVVLFQPRDACRVMPLGLLQVGSGLREFRVEIVDGRLELAPESRVVELAREAICLGISVPSGRPVAEAFRVTRAARSVRPDLFVVWGGVHASVRPEQCLVLGGADACVKGPGDVPFHAVVEALAEGRTPGPLAGVNRREGDGIVGLPSANEAHIDATSPVEYGLLDLDRHFRLRGVRGIDYCSSRLAADGSWQGLSAERAAAEVVGLARRFRLSEVRVADAEFFGDMPRALAIARSLVVSGMRLRWYARSAARELLKLDAGDWDLLRASGLTRLHVPPENDCGAAGTLGLEDRVEMAKVLRRAGVGGMFSFLLGRAGEDAAIAGRVLDVARSIRGVHGSFETTIRFWGMWPSEERLAIPGHVEPTDAEGWATRDADDGPGAWVSDRVRDMVERRDFYLRRAFERPSRGMGKRLVRWAASARLRTGFYRMDLERRMVELSRRVRGGGRGPEPRCDE